MFVPPGSSCSHSHFIRDFSTVPFNFVPKRILYTRHSPFTSTTPILRYIPLDYNSRGALDSSPDLVIAYHRGQSICLPINRFSTVKFSALLILYCGLLRGFSTCIDRWTGNTVPSSVPQFVKTRHISIPTMS